jgi:hypothetical protein
MLGDWDNYALSPTTTVTVNRDEKAPEPTINDPSFGELLLGFTSSPDALLWAFQIRIAALRRSDLDVSSFRTITSLGADPLGSTRLVEHLATGTVYCLRTLATSALTTAGLLYLTMMLDAANPFMARM